VCPPAWLPADASVAAPVSSLQINCSFTFAALNFLHCHAQARATGLTIGVLRRSDVALLLLDGRCADAYAPHRACHQPKTFAEPLALALRQSAHAPGLLNAG